MSTPTYVSASNYLKGCAAAETAINISGFTQRWTDEKVMVEDKGGSPIGFVYNFLKTTTATLSGETNVADLSTVGGFAFGTAETIANSVSGYGVSAGGWYMDDFEIVQERGSLCTATANFTKHPDIS